MAAVLEFEGGEEQSISALRISEFLLARMPSAP